ncbi:FMN-binding negative transcriptional regulator [Herbiconiux sp. CPCC 205716]|uniref:FMN-binding negative transcriptional regulator n=1 Tax=Herbiconiux gentiana TaxID=2970912 RepID=A0ABT2GDY9_9MICO|nr:FMN-binding negative transcriptional regulator [Herbiconiux gentiana]MCS5714408.1 FMN-binding negative transcriptional regulator [Herbiconiux gentiana]
MRHSPVFALTDPTAVAQLVRDHPWATLVSNTSDGLVASHYPVLIDEGVDGSLALLTHVGRPDERLHELGEHELLVVVQGPHGYVSPGWYDEHPAVPTWNFVTAHLYGTPELLDPAENLRVLEQLVDHFEQRMPEPRSMRGTLANSAYADRISAGTVGLRIPVERFTAKLKMSQNRTEGSLRRIVEALEGDGPYASAELAEQVRRANPEVFATTTPSAVPTASPSAPSAPTAPSEETSG